MFKSADRINHKQDYAKEAIVSPANHVALLLAGGDGTRLQELTREIVGTPIPKQYCRLLRGTSLLEATLSRARIFAPHDRIGVVVNQNHLGLAREQLRDLPESNIFVQPLNRDTGPGMVFSLLRLERIYSDAIVAAFPTDHYVDNDRAFVAHVFHAAEIISRLSDKIAILGIVPDRLETAYGYILPAGPLPASERTFHVEAFTEKPSLSLTRHIISRGGLWNTFVMVFRLSRMIELLREFLPQEFEKLAELRACPEKAAGLYQTIDGWNLSTHFLARIPQHLIMVKVADASWSDWGTPESVERTYRSLNLVPFWNLPSSVSHPLPGLPANI
jgi:mannose-1-phosphate guanylyltransferase